jgi:hypothetical protein
MADSAKTPHPPANDDRILNACPVVVSIVSGSFAEKRHSFSP